MGIKQYFSGNSWRFVVNLLLVCWSIFVNILQTVESIMFFNQMLNLSSDGPGQLLEELDYRVSFYCEPLFRKPL